MSIYRNIITKSNRWYDTQPDLKRFLIFMGIIFTPYVIANYLLQVHNMIYPTIICIIWMVLFCTWRVSMVIYDMIDDKNNNKLNN